MLIKNHQHISLKAQTGAALLALMLVLIVGSSYFIVTKLNTNLALTRQSEETGLALSAAKYALIGYAVSYPDKVNAAKGPGYLPCPDLDNDGDAEGSCALAGPSNWSTGRLPFETLELSELRDGSGARLWYALSDKYRNFAGFTPLNSETAGELTVNGSGDIVAVIIAPGEPFDNQDRDADANNAANYLEDDNNNLDVNFVSNAGGDFNDRLVVITRQELMEAIEKRVLGEVSQILTTYYNTNDAYPWLSPFSDPKADNRILYGTHTGTNNATSLTDSTTDFKKWGVKKGDIIRNVTDGSLSTVIADSPAVLTVTGIHLGAENDFDTGDEYYIVPKDLGKKLDEKADVTSSGSTLVDGGQAFVKLDVMQGDIIDNFTDSSSGVVETVADTTITVRDLTSGAFNDNDIYLVRSYAGKGKSTIPVNNSLLLKDDHKDFNVMGVSAGDVIINLKDGSMGRVASVTQRSITAASLNFGLENDFDDDDHYILPRFNAVAGTRQGLIPFHRVGGFFPSGFDVDWNLLESGGSIVSVNTPGTHTGYITNLKQFVQTSSGTAGMITVDVDEGTCVWTLPEIVECMGSKTIYDPVQGQVTSGFNTAVVTDNTKDFVTLGINPGDIVQNYDDEIFVASGTATAGSSGTTLVDSATDFSAADPVGLYNFLIRNTSYAGPNKSQGILVEIDAPNTLMVDDYSGWDVDPVAFSAGDNWSAYTPAKTVISADVSAITATTFRTNRLSANQVDFDTQEFYRVKSATGKLTGTTTSAGGTILIDATGDFVNDGIQVGDVVHNTSDLSWGEITALTATTLTATLRDNAGSTTNFGISEDYEVYYAYMNSRRYEFRMRFNGTTVTGAVNGSRKRDVCLGYTNCTGSASNVSLPFYNLGSSGTATAASSNLLLEDTASNFKDRRIYPGHVVVNTIDGSNGIITTRNSDKKVSVDELNDGTENDFDSGESYYITAPVVTIKDYDASENELSSATVSIPIGGAQGSIKVSNIDYYLRETTNELPDWFITNKWHQLVYIAYSVGDSPNGGATCTAGADCITLTGGGAPNNNKRALIISAGEPLATQDRTSGSLSDYYENGNNNAGDDGFQTGEITGTFNDQIRVLDTSP